MKKIAFITDNGTTISQHFGRAPYYKVVTVEDQQVKSEEIREKMGHKNFVAQHDDHQHDPNQPHGMDDASKNKHFQMAEAIKDCDVLLCGGMGLGARKHMEESGIQVIMTDIVNIEEALAQWLAGNIQDRSERAH